MADHAHPDQNLRYSTLAVSNADGVTPVALWADPTTHALVTSGGGSGGGGAATIADGADIAEGAIADAAVTAGSTGTISGKLRQISSDISAGNTAQTNGTQQTKITNGTQVADTIAGDSGNNSLLISPSRKEVTFTTGIVANVASTDVSNYRWVAVQINTQGTTSTVTFQGSNDNTNWVSVALVISTSTGGAVPVVSATAANAYVGPLHFRYFRLSVTGITGGTTAGVVEFMSVPSSLIPNALTSTQISLADNADSVVANATTNGLKTLSSLRLFDGTNYNRGRQIIDAINSVGTGVMAVGNLAQFDDVSPTAITENQFGNLRMSANRNLYGTIRDAAGNERGANVTTGGALVVDASATIQPVSTASAVVNVGQKAVATTATQISAVSTVPTNGILIGALSTNGASIFVGGSGVTTTTGAELTPGSSLPFTANLNTLYIISAASTTDKIWFNIT